jgi:hypothetical protein
LEGVVFERSANGAGRTEALIAMRWGTAQRLAVPFRILFRAGTMC